MLDRLKRPTLGLTAALLVAIAMTVPALATPAPADLPESAHGDEATGQQQARTNRAELERQLPLDHRPSYYWSRIEELGYEVTSVNFHHDDSVAYEATDGTRRYEVVIDLAADSGRATAIEVTSLGWVEESPTDPPARATRIVESGAEIPVELETPLSSEHARQGDEFTLRVTRPVGDAIPEGATIHGSVAAVEAAERLSRAGKLVLEVESLQLRTDEVPLEADLTAEGEPVEADDRNDTIRDVGIGAAVGAVLGGLIKGGEGILAGLVIGGGGVFLARKGEEVELPTGTPLIVRLRADTVVPRTRQATR